MGSVLNISNYINEDWNAPRLNISFLQVYKFLTTTPLGMHWQHESNENAVTLNIDLDRLNYDAPSKVITSLKMFNRCRVTDVDLKQ